MGKRSGAASDMTTTHASDGGDDSVSVGENQISRKDGIRNSRHQSEAAMPAGTERDGPGDGVLCGNPAAVLIVWVFAMAETNCDMHRRLL